MFNQNYLLANDEGPDTNLSYKRLRRMLGIIAVTLPLVLLAFNHGKVETSVSQHYYTDAGIVFTAGLFAFGLFLFAYRGRRNGKRFWNDNVITHIGGLGAIVAAVIPKKYGSCGEGGLDIFDELSKVCLPDGPTLQWIHNDTGLGNAHFIGAGLFIALMGYMAIFQFTVETERKNKIFYITLGILIWLTLLFMASLFAFDYSVHDYEIYIGEVLCLELFGFAWLFKGKFFKRKER